MRRLGLALLWMLVFAGVARADSLDAPVSLAFYAEACSPAVSPAAGSHSTAPRWSSLRLETAGRLSQFPAGWKLLVDRIRFSDLRLHVTSRGGPIAVIAPDKGNPLGNFASFTIPVQGSDILSACLSFRSADSLSLLRSVKAVSARHLVQHREGWFVIAAVVCGALLCALAYNLFLLFWLKNRFQLWYVIWLSAGIGYTLVWSGVAATVVPILGGPWGTRVNLVLISVLIGSGSAFFFDFIEREATPRRLRRFGRANAAVLPVFGLAAAAENVIPAAYGDLALNLGFLVATLCIATGIVFGLARRSRAVWFYLAGWSPPVAIFALRLARNFGALGQSDIVDKASFLALAFEAVVLSLAIADRFRSLLRERDVAEVEREMLRRVATTDPMTGLYNRAAFQHEMARLRDDGFDADLLVLDLDDLKLTNDIAGHDAGDALLVEVGRRLLVAAGPAAFVARLGGDEFAVLLKGPARATLNPVLALIDASPSGPFIFDGRRLSASLSAGHARWTHADGDGADIYKKADLALYRAKASGRGCWRAFQPTMLDEQAARQTAVRTLREALDRGQLVLHHQPIVDLASGDVVYNEALLRWAHPERGLLGPDVFASAWDDPVTATAVQEFVINCALDQMHAVRESEAAPRTISVNFLVGQLQGREAATHIVGLLESRGLALSTLIVEVTETVVLGRPGGPVVECLQALRAAGIRVALDDFGTGYASLVHLRDLSADILKIDRSFVSGVPGDVESAKIVRAIVALAHSLGQRVVAEGVETEEQHDFLRELGCDFAQGFLFGKPLPFTQPAGVAAA